MIWHRIDTWAQQSACGRYLVCAVKVDGLYQFEGGAQARGANASGGPLTQRKRAGSASAMPIPRRQHDPLPR